jgi:hypothetical protein
MTETPAQIDLWRQAVSEHQRLEFKEASRMSSRLRMPGGSVGKRESQQRESSYRPQMRQGIDFDLFTGR